MKKEIKISIKGEVSNEALEKYYNQLWLAINEQCGYDALEGLYEKIRNGLYV